MRVGAKVADSVRDNSLAKVFLSSWIWAAIPTLVILVGAAVFWFEYLKRVVSPQLAEHENLILLGIGCASFLIYFAVVWFDPRSKSFHDFVRSVERLSRESPLIAPTVLIIPMAGILFYMWFQIKESLPEKLRNALPDMYAIAAIGLFSLVAYLIAVTILSHFMLLKERNQRRAQGIFQIAGSVLSNGGEPSVAIRTETLDLLFQELGKFTTAEKMFFLCGRSSARNYAEKISQIYLHDIMARGSLDRWENLPFSSRVDHWLDYDSLNGWGQMSAKIISPNNVAAGSLPEVDINVYHAGGLFTGDGRENISYFIAGVCEVVLTKILAQHNIQRPQTEWEGYNCAVMQEAKVFPGSNALQIKHVFTQ